MKPAETIEKQLKRMNIEPAPDRDRQILQAALRAQAQAHKEAPVHVTPEIWRIIMQNKLTKPIAAAIITIAGLLYLVAFNVPAYAIEDTLEAMQKVHTLHLFGCNWDNHEYEMWMQLNPRTGIPDYCRTNYLNGNSIAISRPDKSYQYNKKFNRVAIGTGKLYHINIAPAMIFESLLEMSKSNDPNVRIRMYREYNNDFDKTLIVILYDQYDESRKIFVDPDTKLPVRIIGLKGKKIGAIFKDIEFMEFGVELPKGVFDFEVTEDMTVVDTDIAMKQLDDPDNGLWYEGLNEQEAAEQIATGFWDAVVSQDKEALLKLAPRGTGSNLTNVTEIVELGKLYIQGGCGIGEVMPCRLRFKDGSLKEVKLIIRFRDIDKQKSCVIAGTWDGAVDIPEE